MYIERRAWHWTDWALFTILTLWLGMGLLFLYTVPEFAGEVSHWQVAISMLICYFAPLTVWRNGYTNRILLSLVILSTSAALELYLTYYNGHTAATILVFPVMIVGFHSVGKLIPFNIVAYLILIPLIEYGFFLEKPLNISVMLNHMLNYSMLYGIGLGIRRVLNSNTGMSKLYEENLRQYQLIQEQNNALEQYARQVEKLTLLEERNRLARELHDTVGHTFTSVIMGMDAVSILMETAPDKAKAKLDVLRDVTRKGLDEVRRSIHQIAPQENEGSLAQQLSGLANEFALHTGTQVQFHQSGIETELPKQAQLTLIRCLQESLTNAKRHGLAARIVVKLSFKPDSVDLSVEDDGIGCQDIAPGFGLSAMRERLSALQGVLHVASSPGTGTAISCSIPNGRQTEHESYG